MDVTFIYLMLGLKIPIALLFYIVWWAVKAVPDAEGPEADEGEGGTKVPPHPRPSSPPRPRRGPHGDPAPGVPPRTRKPAVGRTRTPRLP